MGSRVRDVRPEPLGDAEHLRGRDPDACLGRMIQAVGYLDSAGAAACGSPRLPERAGEAMASRHARRSAWSPTSARSFQRAAAGLRDDHLGPSRRADRGGQPHLRRDDRRRAAGRAAPDGRRVTMVLGWLVGVVDVLQFIPRVGRTACRHHDRTAIRGLSAWTWAIATAQPRRLGGLWVRRAPAADRAPAPGHHPDLRPILLLRTRRLRRCGCGAAVRCSPQAVRLKLGSFVGDLEWPVVLRRPPHA
jgi:hypothetical protein